MTSKRGLAFPTTTPVPGFLFTKPPTLITWLYNWSPRPTPSCSALHFIPMQWNHVNIDDLASHCASCSATTLLGFNEPELDSQSNMPVALAAREWIRCIEPLRKRGIRCGSPGISSAPQGVVWLKEFLSEIRKGGSDVDFYALHWYGEGLGNFYDYLWSVYYQLGADRKVWVTEFACTNWNADAPMAREEVEKFCQESCRYLDTLEWVERYAWFGAMTEGEMGGVGKGAALVDGQGKLTELGRWYREGR
ncbi:hypothetical protein QBC34DRAFT_164212 [Podospora aff. communis PSN243]|uniref:Asl1-like glycosyl hydrolase catalytic domain-containing protein n=1 Tax=Podospora aff. communis PSN243 TaxID=3040156 RepID=A0AAV9GC17_9PEZI|nr:hypothetical protein QBC34DRAFT_164212 [Podospora aff. communis PSN243]